VIETRRLSSYGSSAFNLYSAHQVVDVHAAVLEALPRREVEVPRDFVHLQVAVDVTPLPFLVLEVLRDVAAQDAIVKSKP
jgi:hypothetical protein